MGEANSPFAEHAVSHLCNGTVILQFCGRPELGMQACRPWLLVGVLDIGHQRQQHPFTDLSKLKHMQQFTTAGERANEGAIGYSRGRHNSRQRLRAAG